MAEDAGIDPLILKAVEQRNAEQKQLLANKVIALLGEDLSGVTIIALWGLAFKPETDDMREAASLVFIEAMLSKGACVAYDPVAMPVASKLVQHERSELVEHQYDVLDQAGCPGDCDRMEVFYILS